MTTLLVTGFEAFANVERNPSWHGLAAIPELPDGVERLELPVAWQATDDAIAAALERYQPKMVLSLGVHSGRTSSGHTADGFYVEELGHNADHATLADNAGIERRGVAISPDRPLNDAVRGNACAELNDALVKAGFNSQISQDAGRYLCNHTYYRMLEARDAGRHGLEYAAFVHVPPTRAMHPQGLEDDAYPVAFQTLIDAALRFCALARD